MKEERNVAVLRGRLNRVLLPRARDHFSEGPRFLGICAIATRLEDPSPLAGWLAGWMDAPSRIDAGRQAGRQQRRVAGQPDGQTAQTAVCRSVGVRGRSRARQTGRVEGERGEWVRVEGSAEVEGWRTTGWSGDGCEGRWRDDDTSRCLTRPPERAQ